MIRNPFARQLQGSGGKTATASRPGGLNGENQPQAATRTIRNPVARMPRNASSATRPGSL